MSDPTATWQLFAMILTVLFAGIGVVGVIRMSNVAMFVLITSLLAIPTLAFLTFAITPGPVSSPDVILLAAPFVGIALSLMLASIVLRLPRRSVQVWSSFHRQVPLTLILWPCMVVAISDFVFVFEPGFALANLAVNVAWFAVWIPRAARHFTTSTSYRVAAPAERVFAFISDPSKWPLYKPDIESVAVRPPGPLAAGSEIIATQHAAVPGLRGPRMLVPDSFQTTEVVTDVVANELLASRRTDGPDAAASTHLTPVDGGTVVATQISMVVPYRYAVLGTRVALALGQKARSARSEATQTKLRQLLEEPVAAG